MRYDKKNTKLGTIHLCIRVFTVCLGLASCTSNTPTIYPLTRSWEIAVPNQHIPEGLTSLSAESCGVCHQDHYNEWKISTHAQAWTDQQFQAELRKETSPFMCINCHIPLQNQQEYIVTGLIDGDIYQPVKEKNPHFDKALQQEGINCASCHVRNNVIVGPTGTTKAPHKTVKDTVHLSEQLCISCHNATAVVTPTLACSFETGDEWKAGPFYKKKNCISCHMEQTHREVVKGFGERKSRLHYFAGSGIPKVDTLESKRLEGLLITFNQPNINLEFEDSVSCELIVKNEFAGHKVPTGDPERFYLVAFELHDQLGNLLHSQTDKIGEEWEWYPEAKKVSDNNLLPGEQRSFSFNYKPTTKGDLALTVRVTKHRMNEEAAQYNKLDNSYPRFITIFEERFVVVTRRQ